MAKRLYVGNLPFNTTQEEVRAEFEQYGVVSDCKLITDRETGKARGFGFVTYDDAAAADEAIRCLHGANFGGRSLTVNEAEDRRPGGGSGGGNFARPQNNGNGNGNGGRPNNGGHGGGGGRPSGGGGGGRGGNDGGGRGRRRDRDQFEG